MTTIGRLSFLFLLFILAVGCTGLPNNNQPNQITPNTRTPRQSTLSPTQHKRPTRTSPPRFIQWAEESKQWLKTSCSAPCWNGITIGKTTVGEAIDLLKNSPLIDPETVRIVRELCGGNDGFEISNSRKLIWAWSVSPEYHSYDGSIYYSQENLPETKTCSIDTSVIENIIPDNSTNNGIITRINLQFPGPTDENENNFLLPALGEVMEAYGEPSHIVAVNQPEYSWFNLRIIYEKQGFVLLRDARELFELDKSTYFTHLEFSTTPVQDGLGGSNTDVLNIWQGLKSFDFYCKFENGQPCK